MLRDNFYRNHQVAEVLTRFKDIEGVAYAVVKMSRLLTPGSFIWKIEIGKERYYLYAEEYSESLTSVRQAIEEVAGEATGDFVEVIAPKMLDETPMYRSSRTHVSTEAFASLQPYVASSGFDFVYLYHVTSRPSRPARPVRVRGSVSG